MAKFRGKGVTLHKEKEVAESDMLPSELAKNGIHGEVNREYAELLLSAALVINHLLDERQHQIDGEKSPPCPVDPHDVLFKLQREIGRLA